MTNHAPRSDFEVFLILERFRSRIDALLNTLAPLSKQGAPALENATIYYRPDTDVALLSLRVTRAGAGDHGTAWLRAFARGASLPLLEPARLADGDRRRFYEAYLEGYPIRAHGALGAQASALALAERLGLRRAEASGDDDAEGPTTDDLVWPAEPVAAGPAEGSIARPPVALERRLARAGSDSDVALGSPGAPREPRGKRRIRDRLRTIPGRTSAAKTEPPPASQPRVEASEPPPATILTRYLRGDEWTPARLRALSLRGAHLAAGAVPRVGDAVPIALGFGDTGAVLRGRVVDATTEEDAHADGASGFRVAFADQESTALRQLTALLRKARAAGLALEPPPPRAAVRFPLRWPIQLSAGQDRTVASALDISKGGLFLATRAAVGTEPLEFQLPLDWGESPAVGRARVARAVSPAMARGRGLAPGYGVEIVDLRPADQQRYDAFLYRVSRRAQRRVVIAAGPERAAELTSALGAVGYAVTSCSDEDWLESLPDAAPQPPDAVVLDLAPRGISAARLQRHLEARATPCITVMREPATRVRTRIDRALGIG